MEKKSYVRHWYKIYFKSVLLFRECANDKNTVVIVAVYYYYFMVENQVFGEKTRASMFQLLKVWSLSVLHSWYSLNWTYFRLHSSQSTMIPLLFMWYTWQPLTYSTLCLREDQESFMYLSYIFLEAQLCQYKIQIFQGLEKTFWILPEEGLGITFIVQFLNKKSYFLIGSSSTIMSFF